MDFIVLTIFPEMINSFWDHGIIRLAIERNQINGACLNIRDFTDDKHRTTDDRPYGGGCGMVMKPEPLSKAIKTAKVMAPKAKTVFMTPQGRPFNQQVARQLAQAQGLILICGRYEGVDERITANFVDDEISVGDYILTGGELPAMIVIDAVTRLIPGVLGGETSAINDSFENGLLEHAHYTRPAVFEGDRVPGVLLSGNHQEIDQWRLASSLIRTFLKRPDLFENRRFSFQEKETLKKWQKDIEKYIDA